MSTCQSSYFELNELGFLKLNTLNLKSTGWVLQCFESDSSSSMPSWGSEVSLGCILQNADGRQ